MREAASSGLAQRSKAIAANSRDHSFWAPQESKAVAVRRLRGYYALRAPSLYIVNCTLYILKGIGKTRCLLKSALSHMIHKTRTKQVGNAPCVSRSLRPNNREVCSPHTEVKSLIICVGLLKPCYTEQGRMIFKLRAAMVAVAAAVAVIVVAIATVAFVKLLQAFQEHCANSFVFVVIVNGNKHFLAVNKF